ncbi:MAG: GGDEF domain-containing protein, partial [Actinomycetota bacterium]|nr:GGDEF domain-containing protein [Actinomycetota bacterium]
AFDVRISELGKSTSDSAQVALIAVDVDRLKEVNDAHGHEAGDRTLHAIADALSSQVRSGDLVARLGGDEFVAVLEGMDRADAGEVAERMVDAVAAAVGPTVTVSLGVATGPAAEAGSSLLRAADRAMYAAKRNRRVVMTGPQPLVPDDSRQR